MRWIANHPITAGPCQIATGHRRSANIGIQIQDPVRLLATLGTYLRVLAVLGLEADINAIAADDKLGRKLQDLALMPEMRPRSRAGSKIALADRSEAADIGGQRPADADANRPGRK